MGLFNVCNNPLDAQQRATLRDGTMARHSVTYERFILVPHHALSISGAIDRRILQKLGRSRTRIVRFRGGISSRGKLSSRVGAIPHQREEEICPVREFAWPDLLRPSAITMDLGNKTIFNAMQKGRVPNELIHKPD